jgi:hypothetical protein
MSASMPENQQVVYSRSIKISDTAKGIRIDVHVYANDMGRQSSKPLVCI